MIMFLDQLGDLTISVCTSLLLYVLEPIRLSKDDL
jgi:hypothetical protein